MAKKRKKRKVKKSRKSRKRKQIFKASSQYKDGDGNTVI